MSERADYALRNLPNDKGSCKQAAELPTVQFYCSHASLCQTQMEHRPHSTHRDATTIRAWECKECGREFEVASEPQLSR